MPIRSRRMLPTTSAAGTRRIRAAISLLAGNRKTSCHNLWRARWLGVSFFKWRSQMVQVLLKRSGGVGYYYFISGCFLFGHTLPLVYNKTMLDFLVDLIIHILLKFIISWPLDMERTEPPPLSTTQVEYKQLVSEFETQTSKPKWFNGALVLIAATFFIYMLI